MKSPEWVQKWRLNITDLDALLDFCQISKEYRCTFGRGSYFPLNVPMRIASKMKKGVVEDPLFRQFVPLCRGERSFEGSEDPLEEKKCMCTGALMKKYEGRALILVTNACAMHCQFCFRQHCDFKYRSCRYEDELAWISRDITLEEIILSGGDPLSLYNEDLNNLVTKIGGNGHVQRIRIHTRFPIGIPERIDDGLLDIFESMRQTVLLVLHVNHENEIDDDVAIAVERLRRHRVIVLSQSVLLRGVNDSIEDLSNLFKKLISIGIVPYYLHQLDKVFQVMHYEVPVDRAMMIMKGLHESLPGYMIPRYVEEVSGAKAKNIFSTYPAFVKKKCDNEA